MLSLITPLNYRNHIILFLQYISSLINVLKLFFQNRSRKKFIQTLNITLNKLPNKNSIKISSKKKKNNSIFFINFF